MTSSFLVYGIMTLSKKLRKNTQVPERNEQGPINRRLTLASCQQLEPEAVACKIKRGRCLKIREGGSWSAAKLHKNYLPPTAFDRMTVKGAPSLQSRHPAGKRQDRQQGGWGRKVRMLLVEAATNRVRKGKRGIGESGNNRTRRGIKQWGESRKTSQSY